MKKARKYAIRSIISILIVLLLIWSGLSVYLLYNKKAVIEWVKVELNKQIKGDVAVGDINIGFIKTFPILSVSLSNVTIRDSLWNQHQHDFLNAGNIYLRLSIAGLFSRKVRPDLVIFEDARFYLYIDTAGNSNLVRKDNPETKKGSRDVPDLLFRNTRFTFENAGRHKLHDLTAQRLKVEIDDQDSIHRVQVNLKSKVHGLTFNPVKGSYLENKNLEGAFELAWKKGVMSFNNIALKIANHPYRLSGKFYFSNEPKIYFLNISTREIQLPEVAAILTKNVAVKLDSIKISKPVDVHASLVGEMKYKSVPLVKVNVQVNDASVTTPAIALNNSSFTASFTNEIVNKVARTDENSRITITDFHGNWGNIPLTSSRLMISNLKNPFLECDLQSDFKLADINSVSGSNTIHFKSGNGKLDIQYKGSVANDDTVPPVMNGSIRFGNADIHYLPRDFVLTGCKGSLLFRHHDLLIPQLNAHAGKTFLQMKGDINNFLALVNINPEKLVLNWQVFTAMLNLEDFLNFIGSKKPAVQQAQKRKQSSLVQMTGNIDKMLKDGVANINLAANNVLYKKFKARQVKAEVQMIANKIALQNASLLHAGGTVNMQGALVDNGASSYVSMRSNIRHIQIPEIFYAFNNFGQDAITQNNMKGNLDAQVAFNGSLTNAASFIQNSVAGTVAFSIKDGELLNFEPVMKISDFAFKKRDFSKMRFAELKSKLKIVGSAYTLDRMEIRSNVIKLFVEGLYDPVHGTDMSIQVPLTNISKDESKVLENKGRPGANIRLRARTGEDGNLKVSWDPFNKAGKNREEIVEEKKRE